MAAMTCERSASEKCILKVDDEQDLLDILNIYLEGAGYRTMEARDGMEAIDKARRFSPALILLDILLPEIDGYRVMEELRADPRTRSIPIVVVSAKSGSEDRQRARQLGAVEYVAKPFTEGRILQVVRSLIGDPPGNVKDPTN